MLTHAYKFFQLRGYVLKFGCILRGLAGRGLAKTICTGGRAAMSASPSWKPLRLLSVTEPIYALRATFSMPGQGAVTAAANVSRAAALWPIRNEAVGGRAPDW